MANPLHKIYQHFVSPKTRTKLRILLGSDPYAMLELPQYDDDGLATRHIPVFLKDEKFLASYKAGRDTGAMDGLHFDMQWRAHVACWCATQALKLDGDFVECGVGKGLLSKTIVTYVQFEKQNRKFFLVDTFEGLAAEHMSESERKRQFVTQTSGMFKNNYDRVSSTFRPFSNVTLIKGTVPEVLPQVPSEKVAYLSIDMNNAKPEIAAARFFWPKLVKGGMVLLDDFVYGLEFHEQTQAFLKFSKEVNHEILVLPTGQGLLIKQ
jgi:O-methyltransferase